MPLIKPNGPAIKGVCVAERMEAGARSPQESRILIPTGMNEAWRTFCRHVTNLIEHYECRGTHYIEAGKLSR